MLGCVYSRITAPGLETLRSIPRDLDIAFQALSKFEASWQALSVLKVEEARELFLKRYSYSLDHWYSADVSQVCQGNLENIISNSTRII